MPATAVTLNYDALLDQISREKLIPDGSNIKDQLISWLFLSYCERMPLLETMVPYMLFMGTLIKGTLPSTVDIGLLKTGLQQWQAQLVCHKWIILISPQKHGWLTSDNPGFVMERSASGYVLVEHGSLLSRLTPGKMLHYPLSNHYCLRIQPPDPERTDDESASTIAFKHCSGEELRQINQLTFQASHNMVFAGHKKMLEPFRH
jgi:hypothetical protein